MRINSEEAMITAIRARRKAGISWIDVIQRTREAAQRRLDNGEDEPAPTASRAAGA